MDLSKEAMAFRLKHYGEIAQIGVRRVIELPKRAKRFTQIYDEYGGAYFAKRTMFRAGAHIKKNPYIDYETFLKLNELPEKYLQHQREYGITCDKLFVVYICTDEAGQEERGRSLESINNQTLPPVKVFIGSMGLMKERVRDFVRDTYADIEDRVYVLKLRAGDELTSDFFYRCARKLEQEACDILYTDHDERPSHDCAPSDIKPKLKPDYSMEYLCSSYYIGPSYVSSYAYWERFCDEMCESDEMFIMSCACAGAAFSHIHRVLYYGGMYGNKRSADTKDRIEALIKKMYYEPGITDICVGEGYGDVRTVSLKWDERRKVSVIIPNMNHADDLDKCLRSLAKQTIIDDLEIIIAENNSNLVQTFAYYSWLTGGDETVHIKNLNVDPAMRERLKGHVRIVEWKGGEFNYSSINNFAAEKATGDYLLLLNNDVELINDDAAEVLLSFCRRKGVGAVGAKLFYGDSTIQHAGVILGFGGVAAHEFAGRNMYDGGYMHQADCVRRVSAVTAACVMIPADVYRELGGLDEEYAVAFNDIDLCMRIGKSGRRILFHPACRGWHYESKSRGEDLAGAKMRRFAGEIVRFQQKYINDILAGDPYYNHNLSLCYDDYSYRDPYWFDKDY